MNRQQGGAAALLAAVALAGCTPMVNTATAKPVRETVEVVAVVDGHTIDVATDGGTVRVRLIGIDTPEIGRGGETSECYAEEARTFLDDLVYGRTVEVRSDPTQADVDKYGRLLRHVFIDGHSAAVLALEAGTGHEYVNRTAHTGQEEHQAGPVVRHTTAPSTVSALGYWGASVADSDDPERESEDDRHDDG
ncbi:endonuclease YncB(thermonuclease family) [Microbacterium natoriense]|uniref:Endonuclease YncB(Thermonuclease family) n=1 Tax=Microbacterium natoriense TaxID=284570 RepID=A0AAW8EUY1_9MICO|nr:thermonuclease family protein [Microbacterium natoriense]MDQ0647293.1 endonuclease YncB(thermonuclease family) [Microbacterium natoriense]